MSGGRSLREWINQLEKGEDYSAFRPSAAQENEMERPAMHAFLVTPDPVLVTTFTDACQELGIEVQASAERDRFAEELHRAKYEAVLIDFDFMHDPVAMLNDMRQSLSNRNAVVFGVTDANHRQQALAAGVKVLFERPFDGKEIRRVLHGSYDLMVRERRRYFRCAAKLPALVIRSRSGEDFRCTTMNVSSAGVALNGVHLEPGEEIQVILFLRESEAMVLGIGTVIWDDKHGKTGISLKCASQRHQIELDSWLDAHFDLSASG